MCSAAAAAYLDARFHIAHDLSNAPFRNGPNETRKYIEAREKEDKLLNYHVFEEYGLAIIGASTPTTPTISHVGPLTTFLDPVEQVQKAIWEIRNTTDIRRIVALTHIGYDVDEQLDAQTEGLSLIIGGHSHTLLGDMDGAQGKYPTIVQDLAGNEVFVVTSFRWGEYLGYIDVLYDAEGRIISYHGAPIRLTNATAQNSDLQAQIEGWAEPFQAFAAQNFSQWSMAYQLDIDAFLCRRCRTCSAVA